MVQFLLSPMWLNPAVAEQNQSRAKFSGSNQSGPKTKRIVRVEEVGIKEKGLRLLTTISMKVLKQKRQYPNMFRFLVLIRAS